MTNTGRRHPGSKYLMDALFCRRQHLALTNLIKIARLPALAQVGHFFGERMGVVETPPERSVHVASNTLNEGHGA